MKRYLGGALAALAWALCAPCPAHATNPALFPVQVVYSPDGTVVDAPSSTTLLTAEGTWTFGSLSSDGVNYDLKLNGTVIGSSVSMQITNTLLFAYQGVNLHWYERSGSTWIDYGTTAPVEGGGGSSGLLSGSIGQSGITYSIAFDEEFSKNSISSAWHFITGYPWGNWGYNGGASHGVTFPGDGTMEINGWDASGISGNPGYPGGVTVETTANWATPGYYEIKATLGSAWNAFYTVGNYTCPSGSPNGVLPGEMDFIELANGRASGNIDMGWFYGSPPDCGGSTVYGDISNDNLTTHVWGADVSTTRGITVYEDGVEKGNIPYDYNGLGLCTNASVCGLPLLLQAGGSTSSTCTPGVNCVAANTTTPFKIWWVRIYTESPQ